MIQGIRKIIFGPDVNPKFKIPLSVKIEFTVGNFGFNLSAGIMAAWLMNFYIKIIKIHPFAWSLAWLLYFVWNSINDPIVGYLSDKTRTKYGRRIPWLMASIPLLFVGFILLFYPPQLDPSIEVNQWFLFFWLFLTLMIYDTAYTIFGLCAGALISELSIEPEERAHLNLYGVIGVALAVGITFVVPFLFIINADPYEQNLPIIQTIVLIFGIIGAICMAIMTFGIKERKEFCFAEDEMEKMKFFDSIKYTIKNKPFLIFTAFFFMITYIQLAMYSQISFFIQDVLEIKGNDIFTSAPILFFVGASLLGFPLGILLNQKYGGKRACIYCSLLVIIGLIILTFSNNIIMANSSLFIVGLGYSATTILIPVLICDIIDKDELETGHRREGAYFGTLALFTKPAQSVAAAITGLVLFFTGYNESSIKQTELAKFGIKLNIGFIPALFLLIGIIILSFFPIDGSKPEYKKWKKEIEMLHDQKLEALRKACGDD
ncbi:MAG: MFS transporter [Promethearchaeota archaeon]